MSARDAMLADIRAALGRKGPVDGAARAALEARLNGHKVNLVPRRGLVEGREKIEAFVTMAEFSLATVRRVRSDAEVPLAVAEYLKSQNLPPRGVTRRIKHVSPRACRRDSNTQESDRLRRPPIHAPADERAGGERFVAGANSDLKASRSSKHELQTAEERQSFGGPQER